MADRPEPGAVKRGFRQSMGAVHTWAGLTVGWVLYLVFLTGTAGYFDTEIDRWMQPERALAGARVPADEALARALDRLGQVAPEATRWFVGLPDRRERDITIFWSKEAADGKGRETGREALDAATGAPGAYRETGGGQFLYRLHYRLHYLSAQTAYWIVGVCTMFMLVAIVTGVIVHKRIFRDFFAFRPGKGQRSWLDAHNVLSVVALPFHLMITYSGLVFFAYLYMAPVIAASYGVGDGARDVYFDELFDRAGEVERAGAPATLAPLGPMLDAARQALGSGEIRHVEVFAPGDASARLVVSGARSGPSRRTDRVVFEGASGALLNGPAPPEPAKAASDTLLGLHEGLFAGPVVRWLYFLAGLAGTAMVGAGLTMWTVKRRERIGQTLGFRLVERLNLATIVGLPVAIAGYFWANRLIPVAIEGRAAWEAHAMFGVWAAMLAHAIVRPTPRAWVEQLAFAAAAFALLPVVNALTTDRHLGATLPAGAWDMAGFDLTVLGFGIAFALAARAMEGRRHAPPIPRRPSPQPFGGL